MFLGKQPKTKEISYAEIGVLCIVVSATATTLVNLPIFATLFKFLAFGTFALEAVGRMNRQHDKFFKDIGLCKDNKYPKLISRKTTTYGEILKFKKPTSITSKDFQDKAVAISEYFGKGKGEVIATFKNGFIFVELHTNELERMYRFEDIEPETLETAKPLEVVIGKTFNETLTLDIAECPNLIIAGETGGGKSNLINLIITFLLRYKAKEHGIDLHLMDFKEGVELNRYTKHPSVLSLSTSISQAVGTLNEIEREMKRRYELFKKAELKDFESYNNRHPRNKLNPIIIIIDEFSEFYLNKNKKIILQLELLASRIRAAGIHLIVATQRPDKEVVNGRIKVNLPTRICYQVADGVNSRIVLDVEGAEDLRSEGHCLIRHRGQITEVQTFFIDEVLSKRLVNESMPKSVPKQAILATFKENPDPQDVLKQLDSFLGADSLEKQL